MNTISSISEPIVASLTVLGSRFEALLFRSASVDEFQEQLKRVRGEHPKATHHCQAYRIGTEAIQEFASDDGEPSGTAGLPMLNVLKKHALTQTSVIVVRYFGGTKLGKKGLIDAYRESTERALAQTSVVPLEKRLYYQVRFPYAASNEIRKLIHDTQAVIVDERFQETVTMHLLILPEKQGEWESRIGLLSHIGLNHSQPEIRFC